MGDYYNNDKLIDLENEVADLKSKLSEAKKDAEGWRQAQAKAFAQVADWSAKNRDLHDQLLEAKQELEITIGACKIVQEELFRLNNNGSSDL